MDTVSRPLVALLVATLALFALWFVALKPSSSSNASHAPSAAALQSDVAAAHHAVSVANAAAGAQGGDTVRPSGGSAAAAAATANATRATDATRASDATPPNGASIKIAAAAKHRRDVVTSALNTHRVVALLFYNPAATDDRAVERELSSVPTRRHGVVKLAVPLSELARYHVVTTQVPVNQSPTLVIIDRAQHASTIVGFADRFEITQRVADAAATR